jgi:hypothetical protein
MSMPRLDEIGAVISRSRKKILYFICEERDFISQVVDANPEIFLARVNETIDPTIHKDEIKAQLKRQKLSALCMEDCYYFFQKERLFPTEESQPSPKTAKRAPLGKDKFLLFYQDFHLLRKEHQTALLKQFLDYAKERQVLLLLAAPYLQLPEGFAYEAEVIDVPHPNEKDILAFLYTYETERIAKKNTFEALDEEGKNRIQRSVADFKGLELSEVQGILDKLTGQYGSFYGRSARQRNADIGDPVEDIAAARQKMVLLTKREKAKKDPTISILETSTQQAGNPYAGSTQQAGNPYTGSTQQGGYSCTGSTQQAGNHLAGMNQYKEWFDLHKGSFFDPLAAKRMGRMPIKGVLITGLPGTGKTQGAKYTAETLGVPLVQLRFDHLLGGLVGDSEKNFKRYRKMADAIAPCVVLIDEIEKLFEGDDQGGQGSSEVKRHLLTSLLDWMQENKTGIFFYATCNSASHLKPELLRDGRFSMRYYVYLPTFSELTELFFFYMNRIHLMSEGAVFGNATDMVNRKNQLQKEAAEAIARDFLDRITAYGTQASRNMFFTGANLEALLNNVQYQSATGTFPSKEAYLEQLLLCAKSETCQPYGETNFQDAVNFWIDALENHFADASHADAPLSFRNFDQQRGIFKSSPLDQQGMLKSSPLDQQGMLKSSPLEPGGINTAPNSYDAALFKVFHTAIEEEIKRRKKR